MKRCPHKIPTVEEINPELSKAKFFSKLYTKTGYWSICLAKDSTELTTFRTPFGRYCYLRLPFGLSVSQDIFQQHMDCIIEKCEGVHGINDDLIVHGATEEEHGKRLHNILTKQLVSKSICLQYYDPTAEVHLEVDASIKGLSATLIQKQQPVAFASKSQTPA